MKRVLCILLICTMLAGVLPLVASADAIGRFDNENITDKSYLEDTIIFGHTGSITSPSSSADGAWNRYYAGVDRSFKAVADPLDATNTTIQAYAKGNISLEKNRAFPETGEFIWEYAVMIGEPVEGDPVTKLTLRTFGRDDAVFTLNADKTTYTYSFGTHTGTVKLGTWMRYVCHVIPGAEGTKSADTLSYISLYGNFTDQTAGTTKGYQMTVTGVDKSLNAMLSMEIASGSHAGFYIDDVYLYRPGDFGPATITPDTYEGDANSNVVLDGKVHIQLYHRLNASRFDPASLKLYDDKGDSVDMDVIYDHARPDKITLDFSAHPLKTDTIYTLVFPENSSDDTGRLMKETELTFRTRSEEGESPARIEVVKEPDGGYVMPDLYNTGYRCAREELAVFGEKYPDLAGAGWVEITEALARKYNYEFSHFVLSDVALKVTATSPVYIHDALFINSGIGNGMSGKAGKSARLTVAWCEGDGSIGDFFGGENLTISHCYVHDVKADHMKGSSNQIVEFNYFRDGGTRNAGAHADVIQFMGSDQTVQNDVRVYGNRFDIPGLGYEHVANCAFFFKPEGDTKGYANVQAIGNWFNGGGFTTYLTPAGGIEQARYLTYRGNKIGCGYAFGPLNKKSIFDTASEDYLTYEDNDFMTALQAGSVVYYNADGTRVYDIADMAGGGSLLINFANYIAVARTYRVEVQVLNARGQVVSATSKSGEVRRYTPYEEYYTDENTYVDGTWTDSAGTHNIVHLKELPDLPHDVPDTIALTALPADMTDCRIEVKVYDTTEGTETLIRTSALSDEVEENMSMPASPAAEETSFAYDPNMYISDWSGKTPAEVLAENSITWDVGATGNAALAEGVLTLTNISRENISLPLDTLTAGPVRLAFDLYRKGDGTDDQVKLTIGARSVLTLASDGTVTVGDQTMRAVAGWNTVEVILLPYELTGTITSSANVVRNEAYVRVTPRGTTLPSFGITGRELNGDRYLHTSLATLAQYTDVIAHLGAEAPTDEMKLANLSAANLTPSSALQTILARWNGQTQTVYVPKSAEGVSYALPRMDGVDRWILQSRTTGIREVLSPGDTVSVTSDAILYGAVEAGLAFSGGYVSLGGEVALNMMIRPDAALAASRIIVFDADTVQMGIAGAADESGIRTATLTGIRAADMARELPLYALAESEGVYYLSASKSYSPLIYAQNMLAKSDTSAQVKRLLTAMLYYGAAAEENLHGTTAVAAAVNALGLTRPTTVETYTNSAMTAADFTAIGNAAQMGAILTGGINLVFAPTDAQITAIRISEGAWNKTFYADSGYIHVKDLHAGTILNTFTLEFLRGDGTVVTTAAFSIGSYLETRLDHADADAAEKALVWATIVYMMEARAYAAD